MSFAEYATYDGLGLAELVRDRQISVGELVDTAIARAERANSRLNFVVFADYERARQTAKNAPTDGLFAGVPFFLKDVMAFAQGMPTRQGARFMPPFPMPHDCVLVARFKAAGLIPLGKTNVPEFGLVPTTESKLYGPARNPWNLEHSTGGSSGGSAAAVAAGVVPLAHANDGGGSIRIPASCCGLVGLKPTRARNTMAPDLAEAVDGLAIDNVVSRSVRDTAAALDATAGNIDGDPYWAPPAPASYLAAMRSKSKRLRIGFTTRKLDGTPLHPDCEAAVQYAARLCADLGHTLEEASPSFDAQALAPAFMTLWTGNLAAGIDLIARLTGQTPRADLFEGLTWGIYEAGKRVSASEYLGAKQLLQSASRTAAAFFATHDAWLTPTLGTPPVKLGTFDMEERDIAKGFLPFFDYVPYTALQNVTGQPAINVPLSWNAGGLPIGVQFAGRFGDELTLLQLAGELEAAAPWAHRYAQLEF